VRVAGVERIDVVEVAVPGGVSAAGEPAAPVALADPSVEPTRGRVLIRRAGRWVVGAVPPHGGRAGVAPRRATGADEDVDEGGLWERAVAVDVSAGAGFAVEDGRDLGGGGVNHHLRRGACPNVRVVNHTNTDAPTGRGGRTTQLTGACRVRVARLGTDRVSAAGCGAGAAEQAGEGDVGAQLVEGPGVAAPVRQVMTAAASTAS
jgi:hypothetical protein